MAASKIYINFRVYANNLCNKDRNLAPKPLTKLHTNSFKVLLSSQQLQKL